MRHIVDSKVRIVWLALGVFALRSAKRSEGPGRAGNVRHQLPIDLSAVHSTEPMGVPKAVMFLGFQTSGPSSSTFCGTVLDQFHTLVLPSLRIPAPPIEASDNKSNSDRLARSGKRNCSSGFPPLLPVWGSDEKNGIQESLYWLPPRVTQ